MSGERRSDGKSRIYHRSHSRDNSDSANFAQRYNTPSDARVAAVPVITPPAKECVNQ